MSLDLNTIEWIKKLEQENDALKKRNALLESIMYNDVMGEIHELEDELYNELRYDSEFRK